MSLQELDQELHHIVILNNARGPQKLYCTNEVWYYQQINFGEVYLNAPVSESEVMGYLPREQYPEFYL